MKYVSGRVVIGIDPGLTGALAFLPDEWTPWVEDIPTVAYSKSGFVKNAVDGMALARMLEYYAMMGTARVFMERVNAFPGQGVGSVFSLGMTFGAIAGVVAALRLPLQFVGPAEWKAHFRLGKDKDLARGLAARLYPDVDLSRKKDHNRAEALLIARFGKERANG